MSVERAYYLDSSAIVKLVVREIETDALTAHLRGQENLVSSGLARTEVLRAVLDHGPGAQAVADQVLDRLELLRVSDRVLQRAGTLKPSGLRSLDAIHLASALAFGESVIELVCYDLRLAEAARGVGLTVTAPS